MNRIYGKQHSQSHLGLQWVLARRPFIEQGLLPGTDFTLPRIGICCWTAACLASFRLDWLGRIWACVHRLMAHPHLSARHESLIENCSPYIFHAASTQQHLKLCALSCWRARGIHTTWGRGMGVGGWIFCPALGNLLRGRGEWGIQLTGLRLGGPWQSIA